MRQSQAAASLSDHLASGWTFNQIGVWIRFSNNKPKPNRGQLTILVISKLLLNLGGNMLVRLYIDFCLRYLIPLVILLLLQ